MTPTRAFYPALFAVTMLTACAGEALGPTNPATVDPEPGHAFLKIIGDKNVFIDAGALQYITVKYVDDQDQGLAGTVSFRIDGDAQGATLSADSMVTGSGGEAKIQVRGGATQAAFRVVAEAQYATPVDWAVSVKEKEPPQPLNIVGTYRLESTFDLANGLPGTIGDVVHTIIDLTDGPNDPATWLLDEASQDSFVKSALDPLRPEVDIFLNQLLKVLTTYSADGEEISVVGKFQEFGDAFGNIAQHFGLKSQLEIYKDASDGKYYAKHTIDGVFFKIGRTRTDKTLLELGMDNIVVDRVPITLTGETSITIGDHDLPLSYGKLVLLGVDNVLLPIIDPGANSLRELLADIVPCQDVGTELADYIGVGDPSLYESICDTAVAFAGSYLEGRLSEVGGTATMFTIHGTARPIDKDSDRTVDTLASGLWSGKLELGSDFATLSNERFTGQRMTTN